ncbi:hypothetical protein [Actinomycetospora callitridis]|uniref:hypothetical protein n=1 Tax=Actinomycetospora callitridis TaxID=913944 RepID=UPI00236702D2|nr:hypothetical protein [Actinomycetospora callitridis]MDD7916186.1 hypothetical protein [Actinomycetospora callitridis]
METTTQEPETPEPVAEDVDEPAPMSRGKYFGISALIVLTLLGMLASTAPKSEIKNGLLDLTRPFLLVTGLDQAWGVFAPSPPRTTNLVVARVDRVDGTVGVYPLEGSDGLAEYWDYRWRKYGEQLWKKRAAERERTAFAGWIADQDRATGHQPVRVTLVRVNHANPPPGSPEPSGGTWRDIPFFTVPVSQR